MAAEGFVSAVSWPIGVGLFVSWAMEGMLTPRPLPLWKRPGTTTVVHLGLWLLAFTLMLAVLARPWFAAAAVTAFLLLLVLVSQAKFHSLREPFVFQDFEYFTDALRHPRLYLPFLGWGKALLAGLAFALAIYAGFRFESSVHVQLVWETSVRGMVILGILSSGLLWAGSRRDLWPAFDPHADLRRLGFLASLWCYGLAERSKPVVSSPYAALHSGQANRPLPHLVVVQSESFFDPRRVFSGIREDVLADWDAVRSEAMMHGHLAVPAWGANTVRSEFAFLSGLDEASLGVHRFNPYRRLSREGLPTIASYLKHLGYRTICIHPYPASFYAREKVYPQLGFDRFIDIREFAGAEYFGPYVGDLAVAEKVEEVLKDSSGQPVFVFVITMENHGPLHLEHVSPEDVSRFHTVFPPQGCEDLTVYLRHLSNAGKMAMAIRNTLETMPGDAWFGWFGDHVPIMPKVYECLGVPDGRTDYFLWHKNGVRTHSTRQSLTAEGFGLLLLRKMGVATE